MVAPDGAILARILTGFVTCPPRQVNALRPKVYLQAPKANQTGI
jgi:hypothetical protein